MIPTLREQAIKNGNQRYFTGKSCKNGHIAERLTKSGACAECKKEFNRQGSIKYLHKIVAWNRKNAEKIAVNTLAYRRANPHKPAAATSRRRARKLLATPQWADHEIINEMYRNAAELGMHVDHVIPLRHPLVCGLHVHFNLQLLTPTENKKKGNKFTPI